MSNTSILHAEALACAQEIELAAVRKRVESVVRCQSAFVGRSLRHFGVPAACAEDAKQLVFLAFSRRVGDVSQRMERAFLIGICVRVAANVRRSQLRTKEDAVECDGLAHPSEDPERLLEWKQRREAMMRLLDRLPPEQRHVLLAFELEGRSLVEIAHEAGIAVGTATSRLRRARERFAALTKSGAASVGEATPRGRAT